MDLRDVLGIGTLLLGVLTFGYNWLKDRGQRQKAAHRDELVRFATDPHVSETFSKHAVEDARRAGAYLSLELAESARRAAAKSAKRATSGYWRSIIGYGVGTIAAVAAFVLAVVIGWSDRNALENAGGLVYFGTVSIIAVLAYVGTVHKLTGVRKATGQLKLLQQEIRDAEPLSARDAKISRP